MGLYPPIPDFRLSVAPAALMLSARSTTTATVSVNAVNGFSDAIKTLARIGRLETLPDGKRPSGSALAVAGGLELYVPLAGLIDVSARAQGRQTWRQGSWMGKRALTRSLRSGPASPRPTRSRIRTPCG